MMPAVHSELVQSRSRRRDANASRSLSFFENRGERESGRTAGSGFANDMSEVGSL
jgi:hypothetical protein